LIAGFSRKTPCLIATVFKEKKTTSVDEKEKVEVKLNAALVLNITYLAIYEPRRDT